jgi:DHA1 family tetracycline resistance protein-like MFS transporter
VLGPALGGVFGASNPRTPFWIAAGLTLCYTLYGVFVLPESLPTSRRTTSLTWARANPVGSLLLLLSHRELFGIASINLLYSIAHQVLPSAFVLYASYRYAWNNRTVGLTLAIVGICSAVVQGGLIRPLVKRLGERRALLIGLAAAATAFMCYGLAPTAYWFWAGIPIGALAGLYAPSAQGLMTRRVGAHEQGALQGANSSVQGVAGMIGPLLFSNTLAFFIGRGASLGVPGAPFLLASVIVVSAFGVALHVTRST